MNDTHLRYMHQALTLARQALNRNEFPVGCVMVHQDRVIARGERTGTHRAIPSELDHAEMIALRRLEALNEPVDRRQITLYATMEPCLMCFGAILLSGIGSVVYAYEDAMGGGTTCDRTRLPELYRNNNLDIVPGVCRQESLSLFKAFFTNRDIDYWQGSLLSEYTLDQK